ncbi:LPD1 domain-containing protein [Alteromonas profundi]
MYYYVKSQEMAARTFEACIEDRRVNTVFFGAKKEKNNRS